MKKRVLSLILALVLCVGLLPMVVSAEYAESSDLADSLMPDDPGAPVMTDVTQTRFWFRIEEDKFPWPYSKTQEEYYSELVELTNNLTRGKSSETAKAKAIFDWVAQNVEYDYDSLKAGAKDFYSWAACDNAVQTFIRRKATCRGYAELAALMNIIAGLPTGVVTGSARNNRGTHVWTAVYADGDWIYYDATWDEWDMGPYYHDGVGSIYIFAKFNYRFAYGDFYLEDFRGFEFPDTGLPRNVDKIGSDAFYDCQGIEHVVIPNTIKYCGERVFRDCKNLKTIEFEEGCNLEMGKDAFERTSGLETVIIPGSLKELGDHMFEDCHKLKNVIIGDGVETIKRFAFDGCDALESISFPSSVKTIEEDVFYLCKSLKSVYVPSSVTSIGKDAFLTYCSKGTTIYTEPGSYAETYAKENKIKVVTSGAPTPTPTPADSTTPSAWAQAEVTEATQAGLVPSDLLSSYTSAITREDFCRLMVKLIEAESGKDIADYVASQSKEISAPFTDTSAQEVKAAYALGIVNGVSATKFNPTGSITRQEAAAMLERTAKLLGLSSGSGLSFTDSGKIASWASGSVAFVSGLTDPTTGGAVMGGMGNGNFGPTGTYTREQAIATTLRLLHCAA